MSKIVVWPDPMLKIKASPVTIVNTEIQTILNNILDVIREQNAIGLSATHIGIPLQLVVILINEPIFMVNPIIVEKSDEKSMSEEGSVSFPKITVPIERHNSITVRYLDYCGEEQTIEYFGLTSICIQHEIDQMNGITLLDKLSRLKRDFYIKKLMKK